MGLRISKLFDKIIKSKRELRILMIGLDGAGKTTILYRLKLGDVVSTIPTIGFNVESVEYKSINFTVWDVGGQDKIRPLWKHYYSNTQALIFVVDSNDKDRINEAYHQLQEVINSKDLNTSCILIMANKSDLENSLSESEIHERFNVAKLSERFNMKVQSTNALTSDGIYEGLDWIQKELCK